jgi:hypothetical protein
MEGDEERTIVHKPNFLLESDVREQLDWDPLLDDGRIVVEADAERIVLGGVVETLDEIERAVGDAWAVGRVKAVDSQLLVGARLATPQPITTSPRPARPRSMLTGLSPRGRSGRKSRRASLPLRARPADISSARPPSAPWAGWPECGGDR